MNEKKNEKRFLKMKHIGILFLAIVLSLIVAFLYSYNIEDISAESYKTTYDQKKTYSLDDVELINYERKNKKIVSGSNDGQIILRDVDLHVVKVKIQFSKKRKQNCEVKLYYAKDGEGFSEEQSLTKILKATSDKIVFELDNDVRNIRIDLGSEPNQEFSVKNIIVRSGEKSFSNTEFISNIMQRCNSKMFLVRFIFFLTLFTFVGLHAMFDVKKMYANIFRYRWLIGGIFILVCTIFKIHGDSMSMYDYYVQPEQGSEFVQPVFGEPRAIRSDEWVVDTPAALAAAYGENPYGKYNDIFRGGETLNMIDGIRLSYSTIARNPSWFIYKIMDEQRAFCFCWNFRIIFTLLISIELFYILTRKNKLYSVLGGCLVGLSPFYLWWNFPLFIPGISAAIVCICYFLVARRKRTKFLYAIGVAVATANFIVNLYPAWQVPVAYIVIAFLIWIVHDYWRFIKGMDKIDWLFFAGALVFCITLVGSYLLEVQEYLVAITNTVYPGERREPGGFILNKVMYYGQALFYTFKDPQNASNSSAFFSLFPIPMLVTAISFFKTKRKDWLIGGLLCVSTFLLIYCSVGLPEVVAKFTLMDFSAPNRAADILGYVNVILLVLYLGRMKVKSRCKVGIAIIAGLVIAGVSIFACVSSEADYLTIWMIIISVLLIVIAVVGAIGNMREVLRKRIWIGLICIMCYIAIQVRPIMMGFDAFYSKPLASAIEDVMEEDADSTWLTVADGVVLPSYAAACGAPTINTVNFYPDMEMWETLDPEGQYNEVYNRYAHISAKLVEDATSMELIQADYMQLYLSYDDLEKLEVDYILSDRKIDYEEDISFEEIYGEYGMYIYDVDYEDTMTDTP